MTHDMAAAGCYRFWAVQLQAVPRATTVTCVWCSLRVQNGMMSRRLCRQQHHGWHRSGQGARTSGGAANGPMRGCVRQEELQLCSSF